MPPHPHHHHGHHGGGGYPMTNWYGGGWDQYPTAIEIITTPESSSAEILRFIATLPKAQRAGAYQKFFGKPAPQGMLGDFGVSLTSGLLVGLTLAVYFLFIRKR